MTLNNFKPGDTVLVGPKEKQMTVYELPSWKAKGVQFLSLRCEDETSIFEMGTDVGHYLNGPYQGIIKKANDN